MITPDCSRRIGNLPANSNFPTYRCVLEDIQEPIVNWASVRGINPVNGEVDSARDSAVIDIVDISVDLGAEPLSVPSPGDTIEFTVEVVNTGSMTVTLHSLTSLQFGDLLDPDNKQVLTNSCVPDSSITEIFPDGEDFSCSFKAPVLGEPRLYPVEVTAHVFDRAENEVTKTGLTTIEITPTQYFASFLPITLDTRDEPNDKCAFAFPLEVNQAYHFFPDDEDDWYYFDLEEMGFVEVVLSDFTPRLGQIIIYDGGDCNSLGILKNNGNDQELKLVPLGIQPPGRYHLLVINAGKPNPLDPYNLQIHFQKTSHSQLVETDINK